MKFYFINYRVLSLINNYGRGDMPVIFSYNKSYEFNIRRFSDKGNYNDFIKENIKGKDLVSDRKLMKDSFNLKSKEIVNFNYSKLDNEVVDKGYFNIDLKNISKYILNRNFIDSVNLIKFDSEFYNLFIYFVSTKELITNKLKKKIFNNMNIILDRVGIQKDIIALILEIMNMDNRVYIEDKKFFKKEWDILHNINNIKNINNKRVEELFYKINEYASNNVNRLSKRNITIDTVNLEKLLNIINNILEFDNMDLNREIDSIIKEIEEKCKFFGWDIKYRSVGSRKHPDRQVEWSSYSYDKAFNSVFKESINKINNILMNWISKEEEIKYNNIDSIATIVQDKILELNKNLADLLLLNMKNNNIIINKNSVLAKIYKINKDSVKIFMNESNRDIQTLFNIIKDIENMESLDNSVNKLSSLNTPLLRIIKGILESDLSNFEKQISIEKALIEYELNYFYKNMDTHETRNKILHKVYPQFKKGYNELIRDYSINNYLKLKKYVAGINIEEIINNTNSNTDNYNKEYYRIIVILVIMYLGIDKCISYSFSQIVNLLSNNIEDNKRTNIVINLGNRTIKLLKFIKIEDNQELNAIFPLKILKLALSKINDTGVFWLGDTLLHLITDNCDIIIEELIKNNVKDSYLTLRLNDLFLSDLTVGCINIVQLPMLTKPREIDGTGLYYPYINSDTTNLHLFEGGLIKGKFNQRYKTEASKTLYTSVNYINSMKFKINKPMLKFILNEWDNKQSKLFKGHNLIQTILDTDSKDIKNKKISSNSLYYLYKNIITLACLYKDQEFYLPVFVDFRGRLYPLSNYLNYQGGDLARSLILFADDYSEILNKDGLECINIYLANLGGYDKLPWKNRIEKTSLIVHKFLESSTISQSKYIEDNIDIISEPFQFMSIMLTKILVMNNPKTKVSNPILFDASCSGIQHIAALTLEKELAINVNIYTDDFNPKGEYPKDFYSYALDKIRAKLSESDLTELRDIKLNRKIIKRSIMTIPYNISMVGIGDHLMEHFETNWVLKERFIKIPSYATISGNEINLNASQYGNLCKIVYFVLTKELPSLRMLNEYFNNMIDIFIKLNLPITWVTPAGLKINYTNVKFITSKVKAQLLTTSHIATIKLPTDNLDKLNMKRSFMPNFIHSLDAANVHLLLANISIKNLPVYTIHDCFASTPNSMFKLENLVKEAFINIYFKDSGYLLKIHQHFVETIISATEQINNLECNDLNIISNDAAVNNHNEDVTANLYELNSINNIKYVMDRETKEIIKIPELPVGYLDKNKNINSFIKGLLNSKYFIG